MLVCGCAAGCGGTSPTTIAANTTAFSIATDETSIYWTSYDGVYRAPKAGENVTPTQIAEFGADNVSRVVGVVVDASAVYWAEPGTCTAGATDGAIFTAPLGGGAPTMLAGQQACPAGLAADPDTIYWATSTAILTMPKAGGPIMTLASGEMNVLALALDATNVYWTDVGGTVRAIAKVGGAETTFTDDLGFSGGVAVDTASVYFAGFNGIDGVVAKSPLGGGAVTTLATDDSEPRWVAVDAADVYWTDTYKVFRTTLDGATTETLDGEDYGVSAIAIDDDNVYWGDTPTTNTIPVGLKRLPK